jgi:hypothetical protein
MASRVPFRVTLTYQGIQRKFFTLFQGRDGSLYIHPNRDDSKPWKTPSIENFEQGIKLDFENPNVPNFEPHKISFHPSGYIHLTNKSGERLRDGIIGPKFEEMENLHLLCVLAPSLLSEMPIFKNDPRCMLVDLVIPDGIGPFVVALALLKGEMPKEPPDQLPIARFILPLESGHKLTFALRPVKRIIESTLANWPPFPFFILATGSNNSIQPTADASAD